MKQRMALLSCQDVSWFDLKEIAALPSEINDDLEKIQDAFGDKFGMLGLAAIGAV